MNRTALLAYQAATAAGSMLELCLGSNAVCVHGKCRAHLCLQLVLSCAGMRRVKVGIAIMQLIGRLSAHTSMGLTAMHAHAFRFAVRLRTAPAVMVATCRWSAAGWCGVPRPAPPAKDLPSSPSHIGHNRHSMRARVCRLIGL
jgi:hypothetical protein